MYFEKKVPTKYINNNFFYCSPFENVIEILNVYVNINLYQLIPKVADFIGLSTPKPTQRLTKICIPL